MLSQEEMYELRDAGLLDDTYYERQEARQRAAQERATRTERAIRRLAARLHQLAHEAWQEDDYRTMAVCQDAAYALDGHVAPTKAQERKNFEQGAARSRYADPDWDCDYPE
jgi:hypothetical protein